MSLIGKTRDDTGFTLLEMLIVVTVLSVAAAVMAFGLGGIADRIAVLQAAERIERHLSTAGGAARRTGVDQVAEFKDHSFVVQGNTIDFSQSIELRWVTAAEANSDTGAPTIVFFGTGGASGGTVEIAKGNFRAHIDVDWLDGRVSASR